MKNPVRTLKNVPTKELLLLLAQANNLGCPYVDLRFNMEQHTLHVQPIDTQEISDRFAAGTGAIDIEDIIDDEL